MSLFYASILIFIVIILIYTTISRRKVKKTSTSVDNKSETSDILDPHELDDPDKYDLHEAVYNFMLKQSQYIASCK